MGGHGSGTAGGTCGVGGASIEDAGSTRTARVSSLENSRSDEL